MLAVSPNPAWEALANSSALGLLWASHSWAAAVLWELGNNGVLITAAGQRNKGWSSRPSRIIPFHSRACREAAGQTATSCRGKHGCGSPRDFPGSPQASDGCSPCFDLSLPSKGLNSLLGTALLLWGEAEGAAAQVPTSPFPKELLLDFQRFGFNKLSLPV